jgi:hypothetical protein
MASDHETAFTMKATPVKFGTGSAADAGWELRRLGVKRAMLVTTTQRSEPVGGRPYAQTSARQVAVQSRPNQRLIRLDPNSVLSAASDAEGPVIDPVRCSPKNVTSTSATSPRPNST